MEMFNIFVVFKGFHYVYFKIKYLIKQKKKLKK